MGEREVVGECKRECNDEFQTNGEARGWVRDVETKGLWAGDDVDGGAERKGDRVISTYDESSCCKEGLCSSRGEGPCAGEREGVGE